MGSLFENFVIKLNFGRGLLIQDQLASLLKAAESLQVKGLADITGANSGANHGGASLTGGSKDDGTDYGDRDTGGEDSTPGSPPSGCIEGNSDGGGSLQDQPKKKRGRPPLGMDAASMCKSHFDEIRQQ